MKRSTFFKSILASIALFLGIKKAKALEKSLFSESFSIGGWQDTSFTQRKIIYYPRGTYNLPFDGKFKMFSLESNGRVVTDGIFIPDADPYKIVIDPSVDRRTKEYLYDNEVKEWKFNRYLDEKDN